MNVIVLPEVGMVINETNIKKIFPLKISYDRYIHIIEFLDDTRLHIELPENKNISDQISEVDLLPCNFKKFIKINVNKLPNNKISYEGPVIIDNAGISENEDIDFYISWVVAQIIKINQKKILYYNKLHD